MAARPRPAVGSHLLPGLAALALFGVIAAAVLTSSFGPAPGFPADASVVASLGRAMFGIEAAIPGESFLVAFEIVDLVLVAALAGAVLLARREEDGATVALLADGGRRLVGRDDGEDDD